MLLSNLIKALRKRSHGEFEDEIEEEIEVEPNQELHLKLDALEQI